MRTTTASLARAKREGRKLVWLTAYNAWQARLAEAAGVDALLVGDSLGVVELGLPDTLPVSLEMMIHHAAAVVRARTTALVVVDLPFASYQASPETAFAAAARVLKETGADAVKLEGGAWLAPTVRFLSERGIAVVGHVGFLPQSARRLGSYRRRGEDEEERKQILADAKALEEAGAVAIVVEHVHAEVARAITKAARVPTIGIGAGAHCDGQVLVWHDLVGISARRPPFAPAYMEAGALMSDAIARWCEDVRAGKFPKEPKP